MTVSMQSGATRVWQGFDIGLDKAHVALSGLQGAAASGGQGGAIAGRGR
ncbi:hypothetical protein NKDENANG_01505 [Candidatus Entotheonellaceae bacterium PAL068K]